MLRVTALREEEMDFFVVDKRRVKLEDEDEICSYRMLKKKKKLSIITF